MPRESIPQILGLIPMADLPTDTVTFLLTDIESSTRLGEEAFASAWNEGRSLSLDQTISLALQEPTSPTER
jgi:hypothetical protein